MTGERDLRDLLEDAVADVEPVDHLDDIRARVAARPTRRWAPAVGGAVLAVAATVTAVAIVTVPGDDPPSDSTGPAATATAFPTPQSAPPQTHSAAVYYLGETPRGYRLFREFHPSLVDFAPLPDLAAALDPDYTTFWPDAFAQMTTRDSEIRLALREELPDAPAGMTPELAELSIQQVVYTVQAAAGERLPVLFVHDDQPVDHLFGVALDGPVANAPSAEVLASVLVSDPVEGQTVTGGFTARGAANVNEGTVAWELRQGDEVVREGVTTASGSITRHFPWQTEVDVSDLEPGTYTFVATYEDVSGGEGFAPDEDTRTVVVE